MLLDLIMRKSLLKYFTLVLSLFIIASCGKDNDAEPFDDRSDYYPVDVGYEWIFDVVQINKTISSDDTLTYQMREEIHELISESFGEKLYTLYRYTREDAAQEWALDSVWTLVQHDDYIVKRENNVGFQKLVFPVENGSTWDGNTWNINEEQAYNVDYVDTQAEINGVQYTETMFVNEFENVNLILSQKQHEIYARNIGLVEYYKEDLETQPGEKTLGTIYSQKLVEVNF